MDLQSIKQSIKYRFWPDAIPSTPQALLESDLFKRRWYYTVELMPGQVKQGQYPDDFPLLPRLMMRNCDLRGATCLDVGTMEGLMPVLMSRGGAKRVVAIDAIDHCHEKMAALKHYYGVTFDFHTVGLMYDLTKKLRKIGTASFDLVNLSGLLYHVFSPMMVLAGARALLRPGGLMIVSTNVVVDERASMQFNDRGRLQEEANTFWYMSVTSMDYILRYLKLAPIDCVYLPHEAIQSSVRYLTDVESGYLSIVCRALDEVVPSDGDSWMAKSANESWEHKGLVDWTFAASHPPSSIRYTVPIDAALRRPGFDAIDIAKAIRQKEVRKAQTSADAHILSLSDRS
jgi:2-polyprenyl-3-methyl-5-hydroxy-6-metoxy-1,4-benzoquinol methylase